jgi:predicted dehydrogenase
MKKVFKNSRVVDDLRKLSDLNLDAVYVTTPIPSHFNVVKTIYTNGIARNLFVEKTLASSYDEAKELCELAHGYGGVNMVGYMRRFAVTFMKAKDLLAQDAIGELTYFNAHAYSSDFLESKNLKTSSSRGGLLSDLGCHAVDLALWFFGELKVDAVKNAAFVEDSGGSVHFKVRGVNGLEGEFNVSWCMRGYHMPEVGLFIKGSKGIIEVDDDKLAVRMNGGKSFSLYRHDLGDNVPFWLGGPEYYRENECFVRSLVEGYNAEPSFYTASKVDCVIDQVKRGVNANE